MLIQLNEKAHVLKTNRPVTGRTVINSVAQFTELENYRIYSIVSDKTIEAYIYQGEPNPFGQEDIFPTANDVFFGIEYTRPIRYDSPDVHDTYNKEFTLSGKVIDDDLVSRVQTVLNEEAA